MEDIQSERHTQINDKPMEDDFKQKSNGKSYMVKEKKWILSKSKFDFEPILN